MLLRVTKNLKQGELNTHTRSLHSPQARLSQTVARGHEIRLKQMAKLDTKLIHVLLAIKSSPLGSSGFFFFWHKVTEINCSLLIYKLTANLIENLNPSHQQKGNRTKITFPWSWAAQDGSYQSQVVLEPLKHHQSEWTCAVKWKTHTRILQKIMDNISQQHFMLITCCRISLWTYEIN